MELSNRQKTSKLLKILGLKLATNTSSTSKRPDDPMRAMQDRMLHKALHHQDVYESRGNAMTRKTMPFSSSSSSSSILRPPRGTLSDDKLPYLDWRLSILMLLQEQYEEQSRLDLSAASYYGPPINPQRNQKAPRPVSDRYPSSRDVVGQQRKKVAQDNSNDLTFAKQALPHITISNDALASIPLLERENYYMATSSGEEGYEEEEEDSNEQYYNFEDETQSNDVNYSTPPPLLPASLFHRATFGLRSSSMDRSPNSGRSGNRKLAKLLGMGFSRLSQSLLQSHVTIATNRSDRCQKVDNDTVNRLDYDASVSSSDEKWNMLFLPTMGGSELARESGLMR
ncbi:hypothetical protein CBS101457_003378 [Exobasidium rhododendri]|nr:hypothetical protein CBS101457_003378 [Exobasidium rhododendri]